MLDELNNAEHAVTNVEMKMMMVREMPKDYYMTVEAIISLPHTYVESVSERIVRKCWFRMTEDAS